MSARPYHELVKEAVAEVAEHDKVKVREVLDAVAEHCECGRRRIEDLRRPDSWATAYLGHRNRGGADLQPRGQRALEYLYAKLGKSLEVDFDRIEQEALAARDGTPTTESSSSTDANLAAYCDLVEHRYGKIRFVGLQEPVRLRASLSSFHQEVRVIVDSRAIGRQDVRSAQEAEALEASVIPFDAVFERAAGRGVVVLGDPGSGKSTEMQRLALELSGSLASGEGAHARLGLPPELVPVLVPLKRFDRPPEQPGELVERALDELFRGARRPDHALRDRISTWLTDQSLLFLLDGLDEAGGEAGLTGVAEAVVEWARAGDGDRYVVTSRYTGYPRECGFESDFLEVHLKPFEDAQIEQFARRWYELHAMEHDLEDAAGRAGRLLGELGDWRFRCHPRVHELPRNPLRLAVLCTVAAERGERKAERLVPHDPAELYDECVDVLLEHWPAKGREKKRLSGFAAPARGVLEPIAWWLHGRGAKRQWTSEADVVPVFRDAVERLDAYERAALREAGLDEPRAFLRTVRHDSSLLTGWGRDDYGFLHLGFQEYLAAAHAHRRADELLDEVIEHFGDGWWREVVQMMLAIDLLPERPWRKRAPSPPVFERFVRRLVATRTDLGEHDALLDACLDTYRSVGRPVRAEPFLDRLDEPAGDDRAAQESQWAALLVLERIAEGNEEVRKKLERRTPELRAHPLVEVRERYRSKLDGLESKVERVGPIDYEVVPVPDGTFLRNVGGTEQSVELDGFRIGRYPVTNAQYARYLEARPDASEPEYWNDRKLNQARQPVVGVSWDEASAFAEWLSSELCRPGAVRLPTEAQWEYAARAGSTSEYWYGDGEKSLSPVGWYDGNSGRRLHSVGRKPANDWGLHDVHGNVWEWCLDWHGAYPEIVDKNPEGPADGDFRVLRGGCYWFVAGGCRFARRGRNEPWGRDGDFGFRVALPADS